jgi:5-methylcytosine-specific restriction protein A
VAIFEEHVRESPRFRNPAVVALKVSNFAAIDPENERAGMQHGARSDQEVWDEWANRPDELHAVAEAILRATNQLEVRDGTGEEDEGSAAEGRLLYRLHRRYERNQKLAKSKKDAVRKATGRLACEVCEFDSSEIYGIGVEVIDVHHLMPLHKIDESTTTLSDLALVCPTCHRVLHAHKPFIRPAELRAKRLAIHA